MMLYNIQFTGCLFFCVMFRKSLFVLFHLAIMLSVLLHLAIMLSVLLHLAIVLSVLLHLAIMLSVLLPFMDFDYHFGIFKLFLELGVHDATFINISAIFLEISFIRGENHIPVPSHWQKFSHKDVSSTHRQEGDRTFNLFVKDIDCICRCRSNYHTMHGVHFYI